MKASEGDQATTNVPSERNCEQLSFDDDGPSDIFEDEHNSSDGEFGHWGQRECLAILPHFGLIDYYISNNFNESSSTMETTILILDESIYPNAPSQHQQMSNTTVIAGSATTATVSTTPETEMGDQAQHDLNDCGNMSGQRSSPRMKRPKPNPTVPLDSTHNSFLGSPSIW